MNILSIMALAATVIANVQARHSISLDGQWNVIADPLETGYYDYRREPQEKTLFADLHFYEDQTKLVEYDFRAAPTLRVPGDWNTQDAKYYYYEGMMWYNRHFNIVPNKEKRYFLYFEGANYETIAGINGRELGKHTGGFTPFCFEVTSCLKNGDNSVIAMVDNKRRLENVPTVNFDWWNYGGLTRSVHLVETPLDFVSDYSIQLSKDRKSIEGWVKIDGRTDAGKVSVSVPELGISLSLAPGQDGKAEFKVKANPVLWCPENPKLYDVTVSYGQDSVKDRIGFRSIEVKGRDILLNGKKVFLRGVCVHEEKAFDAGGRAYNREQALQTLAMAKEMNCNFLRLAHYPHNENMVRAAEEMGIMIWSEIPVYWTIDWNNADTYANAARQLEENIARDRNRAAVIIWSVANETPRGEARLKFLSGLIDRARELDGTRLVSAAMEKFYKSEYVVTCDDELASKTDILSFNQYIGWYDGEPSKCFKVKWEFPFDKPVVISEFGGGAVYGRHGNVDALFNNTVQVGGQANRIKFTEEAQTQLYHQSMDMISQIPGIAGLTPWILKDFRSPKRLLAGTQDDYNRKGLVSEYGERKQAFYVMKKWYNNYRALYSEGPRIFIAGASTTADYCGFEYGLCGWGQAFRDYAAYPVINYAIGGRSTKSFRDEGRWDLLLSGLRKGDYVMICFAHNDAKKEDPKRYCDPNGAYYDNLCRFVSEVRAKGATPIFLTPVARRHFNGKGKIVDTHGAYPEAVRRAGKATGTTVIDLTGISMSIIAAEGPVASARMFVVKPDGTQDNTHMNRSGADAFARKVAEALRKTSLKSIVK